MGDTTLTPRRTADILKELEHAARSVDEVRRELIQAMAERKRTEPPARTVRPVRPPASGGAGRRKQR
jgi:hypothetical protein